MARKKVEKTPLSPKEAASKEFAMTSCVHSGDPSYRFEVGDSVSIGALKNCVVDEVCEDGRYYGIKYGKDGACYGYWSWLDVRPIPTSLEAKYAQKDSPLFRNLAVEKALFIRALSALRMGFHCDSGAGSQSCETHIHYVLAQYVLKYIRDHTEEGQKCDTSTHPEEGTKEFSFFS